MHGSYARARVRTATSEVIARASSAFHARPRAAPSGRTPSNSDPEPDEDTRPFDTARLLSRPHARHGPGGLARRARAPARLGAHDPEPRRAHGECPGPDPGLRRRAR